MGFKGKIKTEWLSSSGTGEIDWRIDVMGTRGAKRMTSLR